MQTSKNQKTKISKQIIHNKKNSNIYLKTSKNSLNEQKLSKINPKTSKLIKPISSNISRSYITDTSDEDIDENEEELKIQKILYSAYSKIKDFILNYKDKESYHLETNLICKIPF